jgi:threonine synthase
MKKGIYHSKPSVATISNAMDVGDPSNFVRILELFNHNFESVRTAISSYSISDEETKETIKEVKETSHYLLDPHGAVAYNALKKYLENHNNEKGFILETAHPIKFYDVMEKIIGEPVDMPSSVRNIVNLEKKSIKMKAGYQYLKDYLKERHP